MKKHFFLITIACCFLPIVILLILSQSDTKQSALPSTAELKNNNGSVKNSSVTGEGVLVDEMATDFSFSTIDGKTIQLSSLRGQPVIFSFALTTGCESCIIEAENIREAQKQVSLQVIQLAINPQDTVNDLKNFRYNYGSSDWLIGYDKGLEIADTYKVKSPDTTIVINSEGKIIYRDDGFPIEPQVLVNLLK